MSEWIAFIGILIGVIIRTLLPAIRKVIEAPPEEPFKWNHKYTATAVVAVFVSLMVAAVAYAGFTPPEDGAFIIFIQALAYAFTGAGVNSLINEASKWLGSPGLHGS